MKIKNGILALVLSAVGLGVVQYAGTEAQAQSSYFTSRGCASCHVPPVTTTCNGCHYHGIETAPPLKGATNKTTYAPGETVSVTISGGDRSGWVRAILYDQNNTQLAVSTGNASGMGQSTTLPTVLSAPAPSAPGTYTWKAAWYGNTANTGSTHGQVTVNTNSFTVTAPVSGPAPADFDGDKKSDLAVWRPGTGEWLVKPSSGGTPITIPLGASGDKQVPGDYDGDGKTDPAVWRPSEGNWYIRKSSNGTQSVVSYGTIGDTPVAGDYDGDGKTDPAVWRGGMWFIRSSVNGVQNVEYYGATGDIPIPGDYDGDGKTDPAVWRPASGTWFIRNSSTGTQTVKVYGSSSDMPVPADYDGDGKTDTAAWRPASGTWFITNSSTGTQTVKVYGSSSDTPAPADFDGDGKDDLAVWRPASGNWFIVNSSGGTQTIQQWGAATDKPIRYGQPVQ